MDDERALHSRVPARAVKGEPEAALRGEVSTSVDCCDLEQ